MRARGAPRPTKQEIRRQLANLLGACMNLIDLQPTTERERLLSVRRQVWLGLDMLGRVDTISLRALRSRRLFAAALLGPLKKQDGEKWLRKQLDGLDGSA